MAGEAIDAARAEALVAVDGTGAVVGLLTYRPTAEGAEILTLDALAPCQGIGTGLVEALARRLAGTGVRAITVVTTNDNLDALRFDQRRAFRIIAVSPGAVDAARALKPTIPATGSDGIPIRDELLLRRDLP